jgi:putative transposase
MPKQATSVVLSTQEEQGLLQITRRHRSEQQVVLRARIVLAAAQGSSNVQIARELDVCVDTVRLWRDRWVGLQGIDLETLSLAERLQDAPRPGAAPKFTAEQRCQVAALACQAPAKAGRPISQWTGREIADEMKARVKCQLFRRHLDITCLTYVGSQPGHKNSIFSEVVVPDGAFPGAVSLVQ